MELICSVFPGIDLLGRGLEDEGGFCVVRGPDLIWGGDIRRFYPPVGKFDGIIGGSPCQDFSKLRRSEPTGDGLKMLAEFARVVAAARPRWFLLENVPTVPDIVVPGYDVQRFDFSAAEAGLRQSRPRVFQYGSSEGKILVIDRPSVKRRADLLGCVVTDDSRDFADICELQGLPRNFDIPSLTMAAKRRAVGNGVPLDMARMIARALKSPQSPNDVTVCICNCGRLVTGKAISATPACRKRLERRRQCDAAA